MPEWVNIPNLITVVGIVGSVITIICFPITIWQIISMKSNIESSKNALERLEKQKEADLMTTILKNVTDISECIVSLKADSKRTGFNSKGQKAIEDCKGINLKINSCLALLPSEKESIKEQLRNTMGYIDRFCVENPSENIDGAYDTIILAIELLKVEQENSVRENIDLISKSN